MIVEFNVCLATDSATPWRDIVSAYRRIEGRFTSDFTMSSDEAGSLPTAVIVTNVDSLEHARAQAEALGLRFGQHYVAMYSEDLEAGYRVNVNTGQIVDGFDITKFVRANI